jgi:cell division initiation protein
VRLSAVDIQTRDFHRRAVGYAIHEVDAFREEIVDNFEELQAELATLREEARRLRDAVRRYEGLETNLKDTLMLAQRTSEEILSNSRKEAELIVRNAEAEAREIPQRAREERAAIEREVAALSELRNQFEAEFASLLSGFWQRLEGHMRRDPYAGQRQQGGTWDETAPGEYEDEGEWVGEDQGQWAVEQPASDEAPYEATDGWNAQPSPEQPPAVPPDVPVMRRDGPDVAEPPEPSPPPAPPAAPKGAEVPEWMRPQSGSAAAGQSSSQAGLTPLDGPGR